MRLGPSVRRLFGPYEHGVTERYRRIFVDLDDFAALVNTWVPRAQRILEVGCGEGAMTERLARTYPGAHITAIDITPSVGRLYRGPRSAVTFNRETIEHLADREPASFDLVVLADVVHHVPFDVRASLVREVGRALAPGGTLIFKEWTVSGSLIHWLAHLSDRYLTGDDVSYLTIDGMTALLITAFEGSAIREAKTVRPWPNNVAVLVRAASKSG